MDGDERPANADVATLRTVAGCHRNLGRNVTLAVCGEFAREERLMDGIVYLVGLVVIVMAILSFIGLH